MKITRNDVREAVHTSLPIMVTFIVIGIGYGLLMQKHGFGPLWSLASGLLIFSGTLQFVSVGMLGGSSVLMAAVTSFMVSARYGFFSISQIGRYKDEGPKKWYLFYGLCDETYAMLSRDNPPAGVDNLGTYRVLVTLLDQCAWVMGSFLGGWIGTMLKFNSTGIDFAMVAMFVTVFIEQWIASKCHIPAVLGVAATLACRILFGPDYFLIPAMVIIIGVLTVMRKTIEDQMGCSADSEVNECIENEETRTGSFKKAAQMGGELND